MGYSSGAFPDNIMEAALLHFEQKIMGLSARLGIVYSGFLVRYGTGILSRCMVRGPSHFREGDGSDLLKG